MCLQIAVKTPVMRVSSGRTYYDVILAKKKFSFKDNALVSSIMHYPYDLHYFDFHGLTGFHVSPNKKRQDFNHLIYDAWTDGIAPVAKRTHKIVTGFHLLPFRNFTGFGLNTPTSFFYPVAFFSVWFEMTDGQSVTVSEFVIPDEDFLKKIEEFFHVELPINVLLELAKGFNL